MEFSSHGQDRRCVYCSNIHLVYIHIHTYTSVGFKNGPCITANGQSVTTACATAHVLMPPNKHPKTQHYLHLLHKEWHCKTFRPCLLYKSTLVVYKRSVYRSLPYTRQLLTRVSTTVGSMYIQGTLAHLTHNPILLISLLPS